MGSTKIILGLVVLFAIGAGTGLGSTAVATPATTDATRHCAVEVAGERDGVLVTGPEVCFASEVALAYYGAIGLGLPAGIRSFGGGNTIGTHYTSRGFGGSSITIVGTTCAGGVWYPTGRWNNNLESSRHYCGGSPTTFYDGSNCSTGSYPIYRQKTSLGSMNNRASCVRYG